MARTLLRPKGKTPMTKSYMKDLTIVMPSHREDKRILRKLEREVKALGAKCIVIHDDEGKGYGWALKQGIKQADTKLVLTADSDGQHQISDAKKLYDVYKMVPDCKMVVGCRWNLKETKLRWLGRKVLNFIASILAGHYLIDLNSGMRIFDRTKAIGYIDILCDTFSFTTSITMAMVTDKHKMCWLPIEVLPRKKGKSRVRLVNDGFITLYYIVRIVLALRTRGVRACLRKYLSRVSKAS